MVFQSLALFPHRTVGQNIEFPLKIRGEEPERAQGARLQLMDLLRLPQSYYGKNVHEMLRRRAAARGAGPRAGL